MKISSGMIYSPLLLLILHSCHAGFMVGRLREGQFEYSKANGWMSPATARFICEKDERCGGFTYKGFISEHEEFDIFFFHLLINFEETRDAWNWVTYQAEREYITFSDMIIPGGPTLTQYDGLVPTAARTRCLRMRGKCAAVLLDRGGRASLLPAIHLESLRRSPGLSTQVKLELPYTVAGERTITGENAYAKIDRCCPRSNVTRQAWRDLAQEAKNLNFPDTATCSLAHQKFKQDFIKQSKVGIIKGCSTAWPAQDEWSIKGLLGRHGGKKLWKVNFVNSSGLAGDKEEQGQLRSGREVLNMLKEKMTIRIFDPLGEHHHEGLRRHGEGVTETDKLDLKDDYETPAPLGLDLFRECGQLTDYQWTLLSGPQTGTDLHLDPPFANSWNTVLRGNKLWVLTPPDIEPALLQCDPQCSGSNDEVSPLSWFTHVLPQLRGRRWYGKTVQEVLQAAGDTIYVPSRSAHAVLNLDWSVAVTENIMTVESLMELPHKLMLGNVLLPDMEDDMGERREEKIWKCLTRRSLLNRAERKAMWNMAAQVEKKLSKSPKVCKQTSYGRHWMQEGREMEFATGFSTATTKA